MTRQFLITLFEASVRSAALGGILAVVVALARVRPGAARHAVWTAALCAMLAMPVLPVFVPALGLRVPNLLSPVQVSAPALVAPEQPAALQVSTSLPAPPPAVATPAARTIAMPWPAPPVAVASAPSEPVWPSMILGAYLCGVALMLAGLVPGARRLARLRRSGRSLELPDARAPVAVSSAIASPMTVGILRPLVLLPDTWLRWSTADRDAVLAHESAHIRRRDSLVLFAACVNRCVFWFHPLSWWLVRALAVSAEHACDEAAARATGERRRYAELLLRMATSVRRRHGRVAWSAVGIEGSGLLDRRITQVLSPPPGLSATRKVLLALTCVCAVALVAACRQQVGPAPLVEDPETAANLARQKAATDSFEAARKLTPEEAKALAAKLEQQPEDRATRTTLLIYYNGPGQKALGWDAAIVAKRALVLWLIERHPDDELVAQYGLRRQTDPSGYEQAKRLWLAQIAKADLNARALGYAAWFFQVNDKPLAEQLLLRAKALEPDGAAPRMVNGRTLPRWSSELGRHYAFVIVGATEMVMGRSVRDVSPAEAKSAYAMEIRKKLETSADALLLSSAAEALRMLGPAAKGRVGFDVEALAMTYYSRAAELDPNGQPAARFRAIQTDAIFNQMRGIRNDRDTMLTQQREIAGGDIARKASALERLTVAEERAVEDAEPVVLASMSEADRFARLPGLAVNAYSRSNSVDYYDGDPARAKVLRDRSEQYSRDLLALARKFTSDPRHDTAIYHANLVLALAALREGDAEVAVDYMVDAAKARTLVNDSTSWVVQELMIYLLVAGERESVASFLEHAASIGAVNREGKLRDAEAIRAGRMPAAYQHRMTRRS
jgi:beta-lactamase regulating signal transducer with metallopeptidase domain